MNFYATKKFCDDLGYRLPIPRNQAENDALRDVTRDENFFIGIARRMGEGEKLEGPNSWFNQYTNSEIDFTNWAIDPSKLNPTNWRMHSVSAGCKQYVCSMSNMKVGVFIKVLWL